MQQLCIPRAAHNIHVECSNFLGFDALHVRPRNIQLGFDNIGFDTFHNQQYIVASCGLQVEYAVHWSVEEEVHPAPCCAVGVSGDERAALGTAEKHERNCS